MSENRYEFVSFPYLSHIGVPDEARFHDSSVPGDVFLRKE